MSLMLYDGASGDLAETFRHDGGRNRTGDIWDVALSDEALGKTYALKVEGPWSPDEGQCFDARILLIDPYAAAVAVAAAPQVPAPPVLQPGSLRGLVTEGRFDWQDDAPQRRAWRDTVIYETHVRGLTIHPSASVEHPGDYLGVVEKIPYLRDLGITAVELMPVQEFADWELRPATGQRVRNYWGYNPVALFAPKAGYASGEGPEAALVEFKTMVRELHKAGIEVIIDVVFNHAAEAGEDGPTLSFRGLDNSIYYLLEPDKRRYSDFTGCGNTLNCNQGAE